MKPLDGFRLWVSFQDGIVGTIELVNELWEPMFEPLKNPDLFFQASVNSELETVTWPNGADLAPEFLYQQVAQHGDAADVPEVSRH